MTETILAFIPSPSQGVWHIGPVPIRAYALCIIAGIVAALIIGDRRWVARGGEQGVIYDIALLAVPFGLVGGRLYHVMTDWKTYFGDGGAGLGAAFRIWDGGLGIWGAVALGAVGAWIGCRMRGIPLPAFGDAIAPGIILAQAIGRLGNYFNQELYGRETTVPWGLEIYERRDASGALNTLNGVSDGQLVGIVHPTFLYELLWNLLIFALLLWIDKRFNMGHGRLFALYVAGYCVGRFWIELMRSDPASMPVDGIRVNTFTSTFVFVAAVVYIMVAPKGREDPESLAGKQDDDSPLEDSLAKELAAIGAGTGVVAAATVAGAAESEDAAAVGDVEGDVDVAEEAEAADEAEEPVDADTLVVAGEEPDAEAETETEGSEESEGDAAADDAVESEPETSDAGSEPEAVEPTESAVTDEPETEAEADDPAEPEIETDEAEGESVEEPAAEESSVEASDVGAELEAASESLAAAGSTHSTGEDLPEAEAEGEESDEASAGDDEPEAAEGDSVEAETETEVAAVVDEPAADESVEAALSDAAEPETETAGAAEEESAADGSVEAADEAQAEAESEVVEGDSAEVDSDEESADVESVEEAEAAAGDDEPDPEGEAAPSDDAASESVEEAETSAEIDEPEPEAEVAEGDSVEAETDTEVVERDSTGDDDAEVPAEAKAKPEPAPLAPMASESARKPRWWRRNR
ncbi:MAG: prolipoprotein diacylglyceryl transferase [Mycolicibacterium cosmeticum]|nr:prolipoprotein diacylglyceryl transferase [Mycolicibacterium cosmeticum]